MPSIPIAPVAAIVIAFVAAAIVVRIARSIIHRLLSRLEIVGADNREAVHARAKQLQGALTFLAYGIAAVASLSVALERFGVGGAEWDLRVAARWSLTHGINVVIIIVGAFIAVRVANLAIDHLQFKLARNKASTDLEWQRRATTLGRILTSLVSAVVGFVAILMLLRELSIDVVPILTGAGIAGLAVGFGAQNLVRDVISGFFLILEDQVRIGDLARINGTAGIIEQINLRTIQLRDGEGAVHVFPNGTITALANLSKQFAYAVVDIKVAYNENIDRVLGTIREVGASIERDEVFGNLVHSSIEILGVTSLDGGAANIQVRFKTLPLNQGKIANELRRRLMGTFVARRIRPYA
jgi:moderate conductance mechanosensitive channel